ncbi:MAG: hypothetical protein KGJ07_00540 [Patescibacteria group bacterium]|nr:hypothetical protein [Patescibacteria group bacterium]
MNLNKKRRFVNRANERRLVPSDFDRISELQSILSGFGYHSLRGQVIKSNKFIGLERHPDLILHYKGELIPIELDGGVHGFGDEISESIKTKDRNDDYLRGGYTPIIINEEWLNNSKISLTHYVRSVLFQYEQIIRARKRLGGQAA